MSSSIDAAAANERGATAELDLDADLAELVRMAETLHRWETLPWAEVQCATKSITPKLLAHLAERDLWEGMTAAEQASVHWAMVEGHSVGGLSETHARPDFVGPRIRSLLEAADQIAVRCGAYRHPRLATDPSSAQAAECLARLDALPEGWRVEVIRRAAASGDVLAAVASASMALNVLHSVYGIDARTP